MVGRFEEGPKGEGTDLVAAWQPYSPHQGSMNLIDFNLLPSH